MRTDPHTIITVAQALNDIGALPHPLDETSVLEVSEMVGAIVVMMEQTVAGAARKALEEMKGEAR